MTVIKIKEMGAVYAARQGYGIVERHRFSDALLKQLNLA